MNDNYFSCSICGGLFTGHSNNAYPATGVCCNSCNLFVLLARLAIVKQQTQEAFDKAKADQQ